MSSINFIDLPTDWSDLEVYASSWLSLVAKEEGYRLVSISYSFMNDEELKEANILHLEHDYYTDVITFNDVRGKRIYGDVLVSYDRIRDNSNMLNNNVIDERDRVIVHALLHLCGYEDDTDEKRLNMRNLEDKYLALRA